MSGKLCNGVATDQPYVKNSKAYCEGRAYAAGGGLVGDNPHAQDPDKTNWSDGHNSWVNATGLPTQDCCAHPPGGGGP